MRPVVRWSVVALALAAAGCFTLSVVAGAWWSIGPVEIGPHGTHHCFGGAPRCGLGWVGGGEQWQTIGVGAWGAGLLASLGLVVIAAGAAGKRRPRLIAMSTIVAIGMAVLLGILFVLGFPALQGAAMDRGLVLFVAAIVLGLAATVVTLRAAPAPKAAA